MAFFIAVQNNALLFAHCGKANGSQPQRLLLHLHDFADAFVCERQHCLHFLVAEGVAFGGALDFNERAAIVHDDVHVGLGFAVFGIFQIEQRRAAVHADGDGGELAVQRVLFEASLLDKGADGVGKRDETTANRCGARAAVGLENVAVNRDGAFAERGQIDHRTQRAADEALDFHGAPLLFATGGFAHGALMGGARQHAVFGRHPTLVFAAQKGRYFFFNAGGAEHVGVAAADKRRAFGVFIDTAFDADGAKLVGAAVTGAHDDSFSNVARARIIAAALCFPAKGRIMPASFLTAILPMRQSMTAFARATEETARWRISVEMKSVNHRFLEIQVKMGDTLRHLEGVIRERLQAAVARGKVEVWLFVEALGESSSQRLDSAALAAWLQRLGTADPQGALGKPAWSDMLALPGVLVKEHDSEDALDAAVLRLFDAALADFLAMREREGTAIAAVLGARLDSMSAVLDRVVAELPQLQEKTAASLQERLRALQYEADPAVAGQALSQILAKMDIQEELDRLRFHIEEARKTLQQDGAIGRRLDFLMQEFNREANTLGSKAGDNAQSQASVELKVLIEQMREQVQNLV